MALVACYDCGARVSDSAARCPQCGALNRLFKAAAAIAFLMFLALATLFVLHLLFAR